MNEKIEIDGNDAEYECTVLQNAENKSPLLLNNFTLEMVPFCDVVAKDHGYELKGRIPGVCHFIPRNYDRTKIATPDVFSGSPDD